MLLIIIPFLFVFVGMGLRSFMNKDIFIAILSIVATYIIATFISSIFVFLSILLVITFYARIFYLKNDEWFHSCKKQIDQMDKKFSIRKNKMVEYNLEILDRWIERLYMPILNHRTFKTNENIINGQIDKNGLRKSRGRAKNYNIQYLNNKQIDTSNIYDDNSFNIYDEDDNTDSKNSANFEDENDYAVNRLSIESDYSFVPKIFSQSTNSPQQINCCDNSKLSKTNKPENHVSFRFRPLFSLAKKFF